MLMPGADYRESLRRFSPRVYLNGSEVCSVADEPLVERLLERGVLADQVRSITQNRQPGRCCIQGCMVPMPDPKVISLQKKKA